MRNAIPKPKNGMNNRNNVSAYFRRKEWTGTVFYAQETQCTIRSIRSAYVNKDTLEMENSVVAALDLMIPA